MKTLVAIKEVYYASKTHKPGETFDCDDETHAKILVVSGACKELPANPVTPANPPASYETRTLAAEAPADPPQPMTTEDSPLVQPKRPRGRPPKYPRRDMRAEE